jgi:hypothetical protein
MGREGEHDNKKTEGWEDDRGEHQSTGTMLGLGLQPQLS